MSIASLEQDLAAIKVQIAEQTKKVEKAVFKKKPRQELELLQERQKTIEHNLSLLRLQNTNSENTQTILVAQAIVAEKK